MRRKALKAAFPHTIPIMTGYLFLGIGFGILLESKGYSFLWALLMAVFIYAGSMQYVAIELLAPGVTLISTALMTVMLQIRHLFYGLTFLDKYRNTGKRKPLLVFELTDETYSLIASVKVPEGVDETYFYLFISLLDHLYWIIGCTLGGIFGSVLTINTKGIDFIMTAFFVVVFTDQWMSTKNHLPALLGVSASFVCLLLFGADNFILPSMLLILILLAFAKKYQETKEERLHAHQ